MAQVAGFWSLVLPEQTENLVLNPSVELATTDYTAVSASIAAVSTRAKRGYRSLEVTPTATVTAGVYYQATALPSGPCAVAVDFYGVSGVPYTLYIKHDTLGTIYAQKTFTANSRWQRPAVTAVLPATANYKIYIVKNNSASLAPYYVDGLQIEAKDHVTSYIDGSIAGGVWIGDAHASKSKRSANDRSGGRSVNLKDLDILVTRHVGTGLSPIEAHIQEYGSAPGGFFQGQSAQVRTFQIELWLAGQTDGTPEELYDIRRRAINVLKPDRVATPQPFILEYSYNIETVRISAVYDTGMELGQWQGFTEKITCKFIAPDPCWYKEGNNVAALNLRSTLATPKGMYKRTPTGDWSEIGVSAGWQSDYINDLKTGPDGKVYVALTNTPYLRVYDPQTNTWTTPYTINGMVNYITWDYSGNLWLGGGFTTINATSVPALAKRDKTTGVWSTLGGGVSLGVAAIIFDPELGHVWIGGTGMTSNALDVYGLMKWNGSAWTYGWPGGAISDSYSVYALAWSPDYQNILVGGPFTTIGATVIYYAAKISRTGSLSKLGQGFSGVGGGNVNDILTTEDGRIYLSGNMFISGLSYASIVAEYDGTQLSFLGALIQRNYEPSINVVFASPSSIYWSKLEKKLYAVIPVENSPGGSDDGGKVLYWTGSEWFMLDVGFTYNNQIPLHLTQLSDGTLFTAYYYTASPLTKYGSASTTIRNEGSAESYPVIQITGPGVLYSIINETTGREIVFGNDTVDGLLLQPEEMLTIDLNIAKKTFISSFRGSVANKVRRGSHLATFTLQPGDDYNPGDNILAVFMSGSTFASAAKVLITWQDRLWSIDNGV